MYSNKERKCVASTQCSHHSTVTVCVKGSINMNCSFFCKKSNFQYILSISSSCTFEDCRTVQHIREKNEDF